MAALERKLEVHNAAKAKGIMSADEVDVAEARLADLKRRAAAGELTEEERREMAALERQLATHRTAKAASAAAKDMMSSDELDAAEVRLADLRRRKAAGLLTDEERRELAVLERKLSAHHAAMANALMGADEMAEAEARLADLKRRAAAGELTEEERAELETLERRLAAHGAAMEAKGVMSAAERRAGRLPVPTALPLPPPPPPPLPLPSPWAPGRAPWRASSGTPLWTTPLCWGMRAMVVRSVPLRTLPSRSSTRPHAQPMSLRTTRRPRQPFGGSGSTSVASKL